MRRPARPSKEDSLAGLQREIQGFLTEDTSHTSNPSRTSNPTFLDELYRSVIPPKFVDFTLTTPGCLDPVSPSSPLGSPRSMAACPQVMRKAAAIGRQSESYPKVFEREGIDASTYQTGGLSDLGLHASNHFGKRRRPNDLGDAFPRRRDNLIRPGTLAPPGYVVGFQSFSDLVQELCKAGCKRSDQMGATCGAQLQPLEDMTLDDGSTMAVLQCTSPYCRYCSLVDEVCGGVVRICRKREIKHEAKCHCKSKAHTDNRRQDPAAARPATSHGHGSEEALGTEVSAALPACSRLQRLNLGGNQIQAEGASTIAHDVQLPPENTVLNLSGNTVSKNGGAEAIAAGLRGLELELGWSMIGDGCAASFSQVRPACAGLRQLDLAWNKVEMHGAGAQLLEEASLRGVAASTSPVGLGPGEDLEGLFERYRSKALSFGDMSSVTGTAFMFSTCTPDFLISALVSELEALGAAVSWQDVVPLAPIRRVLLLTVLRGGASAPMGSEYRERLGRYLQHGRLLSFDEPRLLILLDVQCRHDGGQQQLCTWLELDAKQMPPPERTSGDAAVDVLWAMVRKGLADECDVELWGQVLLRTRLGGDAATGATREIFVAEASAALHYLALAL